MYRGSGWPIATEQLEFIILKHMEPLRPLASGKFLRAAILGGIAGSEDADGSSIPACNAPVEICESLSQAGVVWK